jgi:apolipoprotein N-acyltransferase
MRRIPWKLLAAAALSAGLLDLPFPLAGPLPQWRTGIAWLALVPLLAGLLRLPEMYPGHGRRWRLVWSLVAGWLAGAIWFGANCYWVYDTMHLYGDMGPALASFSLLLFSLYLGFWFGVFGLALAIVDGAFRGRRMRWAAIAAVPFLWTAMEFALARIPEFPWDLLGYSQVDNGLLTRLAPWTGVYGISFVVAAVNAFVASGYLVLGDRSQRRRRAGVLFGLSLGLVWAVLAWGLNSKPARPPASATAVLVQPDLDVAADNVWLGPEWDQHMEQYRQLSGESCKASIAGMPEMGAAQALPQCPQPAAAPSLVVWPESPAPFRDADARFRRAAAAISESVHAPLIAGTVGFDEGPGRLRIYNSATVIGADGHIVGRYDKMHLVPFGEYVPLRNVLFFVKQITQTMTDMSRGTERKVFTLESANGESHRYGVFICYESVFGDEVRHFARNGAEVLVNISDDGWYGDTSAPWQHLNMARMRAIENRRWILRDTNNGATVAIDPYGTVRQSIPRHVADALPAGFGYGSELTWYTAHGDVFAWICAVVAAGITVWAARVLLLG